MDTETTGLYRSDEIIQLALISFCFDPASGEILGVTDVYVGLREPACPISPGAARVNGLSMADLVGKALDHDRVENILARTDVLIAHNAAFDRRFLSALFPACVTKRWLCSMSDIDWRSRHMESRSLGHLLERHGINSSLHDALTDSVAAMCLLQQMGSTGRYLAELVATPPAPVMFKDRVFVFTGTFRYGSRKDCETAVHERGGVCEPRPTRRTNYLVIGATANPEWANPGFGRKIERAAELASSGSQIAIIPEQHWERFLQ